MERVPKRFTLTERPKALLRLATLLHISENYRLGISSDSIIMFDVDFRERICRIWWVVIAHWLKRTYGGRVAVFDTERGYHIVLLRELPNKQVERARLNAKIRELEKKRLSLLNDIAILKRQLKTVFREDAKRKLYETYRRLTEVNRELRELRRDLKRLEEYTPLHLFWDNAYEYAMDCIRRARKGERLLYLHEKAFARCLDPMHVELTLKRKYTTLRISAKPCKPYDIKLRYLI